MEFWIIVGFVVVAFAGSIGIAASRNESRAQLRLRRRTESVSVATPYESGKSFFYPDRNGRLVQPAVLLGLKGDKGFLRVGHPNNAPFRRPLSQLRRVAA